MNNDVAMKITEHLNTLLPEYEFSTSYWHHNEFEANGMDTDDALTVCIRESRGKYDICVYAIDKYRHLEWLTNIRSLKLSAKQSTGKDPLIYAKQIAKMIQLAKPEIEKLKQLLADETNTIDAAKKTLETLTNTLKIDNRGLNNNHYGKKVNFRVKDNNRIELTISSAITLEDALKVLAILEQ